MKALLGSLLVLTACGGLQLNNGSDPASDDLRRGKPDLSTAVDSATAPPDLATTSVILTSAASMQNRALSPIQYAVFRIEFDSVPSASAMDGVTGLSPIAASGYTDLATAVRFNSSGYIDARNGSAYSALTAIPYSAGTRYHFRLDVNIPAHSYSAYVTPSGPSGSSAQTIGANLAFRTEQAAASSLAYLSLIAAIGSHTIENIAISALSDTTAPLVSITSPNSGASYTAEQSLLIAATASDDTGVAKVEFYDNGNLLGSSSSAPYSYALSLTSAINGNHSLTAKAYDAAGNSSGSSAVSINVTIPASAPPLLAGLNPENEYRYNGSVVEQLDPLGSGQTIDFHRTTKDPYPSIDWWRSEKVYLTMNDGSSFKMYPGDGKDYWWAFAWHFADAAEAPWYQNEYADLLIAQTHISVSGDTGPPFALSFDTNQNKMIVNLVYYPYATWPSSGPVRIDRRVWEYTENAAYGQPILTPGVRYSMIVHRRIGWDASQNPITECWFRKGSGAWQKVVTDTGPNTFNVTNYPGAYEYARKGTYRWSNQWGTKTAESVYMTKMFVGIGASLLDSAKASLAPYATQ